ncbi:hypothetical protein D3C87_1288840 [compost metagenome]
MSKTSELHAQQIEALLKQVSEEFPHDAPVRWKSQSETPTRIATFRHGLLRCFEQTQFGLFAVVRMRGFKSVDRRVPVHLLEHAQ